MREDYGEDYGEAERVPRLSPPSFFPPLAFARPQQPRAWNRLGKPLIRFQIPPAKRGPPGGGGYLTKFNTGRLRLEI